MFRKCRKKLKENVACQWNVRPDFEQECVEVLGGSKVCFLNVGVNYDSSNDKEVRNSLNRDNSEIIKIYNSSINSIAAKCAEYIKAEIQALSSTYGKYINVDIQTLLDQFGILIDSFQPDILIRIKYMIEDILSPSSSYLLNKAILDKFFIQIDNNSINDISQIDNEDILKRK